jgi:adenosylhomocysteine nucleosidase
MNKPTPPLCFVFAMGMEMGPFLHRTHPLKRWKRGKAAYREVFFEGDRLLVVRSGIGPSRARAAVEGLHETPRAVLSVGTAGALVPELAAFEIVAGCETVSRDAPQAPSSWDRNLVDCIMRSCQKEGVPCVRGRIATVDRAVVSCEDRAELHELTGAIAVDMESHAMGRACLERGIPFAALRVISDDFDAPLPAEDRPDPIKGIRPIKLLRRLGPAWRWMRFIRRFRRSIEVLPLPLVRFIRETRAADRDNVTA